MNVSRFKNLLSLKISKINFDNMIYHAFTEKKNLSNLKAIDILLTSALSSKSPQDLEKYFVK